MRLVRQIATPPNGEATIEISVYGADINPIAREYLDLLDKIKEKKITLVFKSQKHDGIEFIFN